jgi:hypothetical protein
MLNNTKLKRRNDSINYTIEGNEVSSDPRENENKNADIKYELTFIKRDESELL